MKFLVLVLCAAAVMADPHWLTLTADEVALVKSTWNAVKHDEVEILTAVFKAYPDIQAKFPKFAGKDLDSVKGTAAFAMHASRIVSWLSEYIAFLGIENTQPAIKTIANQLGQEHRTRGVTKAQFEEFHKALNEYLKSHTHWNADASHAWDDAFDKLYFVVFSSLDGHPVA